MRIFIINLKYIDPHMNQLVNENTVTTENNEYFTIKQYLLMTIIRE